MCLILRHQLGLLAHKRLLAEKRWMYCNTCSECNSKQVLDIKTDQCYCCDHVAYMSYDGNAAQKSAATSSQSNHSAYDRKPHCFSCYHTEEYSVCIQYIVTSSSCTAATSGWQRVRRTQRCASLIDLLRFQGTFYTPQYL